MPRIVIDMSSEEVKELKTALNYAIVLLIDDAKTAGRVVAEQNRKDAGILDSLIDILEGE